MSDLHLQFRLGISTIRGIVEVFKLIWNVLQSEYMLISDTAKWLSIAHGFQNKANFPKCVVALDAKRIRITKPQQKWIYVLQVQELLFNCFDGNL